MPRKFDFVSPGVQITEIDQSKLEATLEDDGLLIIGTAPTGPALKPVKVQSLENFIDVFGRPVSGKGTINDDVWRDGNYQGPTYGMYAAQAWLASNTSPVTFVRLLGEDSSNQATGYTAAGWDLGGAVNNLSPTLNGTAYGLFVMPSASAGSTMNGTLAAVFYTTGSALTLSGNMPGTHANAATSSAGTFIKSIATAGKGATFKIDVHTGASTTDTESPSESIVFHFDPDEKTAYIRNVANTNPQKLLTSNFVAGQSENYFVGEVYEEAVQRVVLDTVSTPGSQIGVLLPLMSGSAAANNLQYHRAAATESKTGWIINRNPDPTNNQAAFSADLQKKLFRLCALSQGDYFERNYYISIEDLTLGTVANPNSTFSVKVRNLANNVVEQFSNLNLDESSVNFIGKRIGDMYQQWDSTNERYEMYGQYENQSNYIRVEMSDDFNAGIDDSYKIPFGFFGPVIPKGFTLFTGSPSAGLASDTKSNASGQGGTANTNVYVSGNVGVVPLFPNQGNFVKTGTTLGVTASLTFPRLKLTEEGTSGIGGINSNYNAKDLFGLRHKMKTKNVRNPLSDRSYIDLLRYQGGGINLRSAAPATQHSFVFTMDEIRKADGQYYWQSGSMASSNSHTSKLGTNALLTSSVKQFALPMFGGFNGLDIRQVDPFSEHNVLTGKNKNTSYAFYSIDKAIETVSDAEAVQYDVISMPGLTNEVLSNKLISMVEDRGDALALIDLQDQYKETYENQGAISTAGTTQEVLATARSRDLNTSYAATHFPRIRLRDTLSGNGDILVAPASVGAIGALAFSDANSEGPWFAPAGFNRGGISILGGSDGPRVVGTWKNLPKSDRDELYELNINPIARFPAVGEVVIFGQKTLQQTASALDRINVRRLMVFLKKRIGAIADTILFDQNVQSTFARFKSSADLILTDVQARFGISEFKIVLDETTTTPDLVDQNIMYAKIFVKPARAIEFIAIDFIITRSGVQF